MIKLLTFPYLLLIRDFSVEVATVREVHDDAKTLLVHEAFFIGDDIRMAHRF